ncbi:MAG: hypothetical protein ACRCS8_01870 [Brevinema sp.]
MSTPYFNKFTSDLHVMTFSLDDNSFEDYNLDTFQKKEGLGADIVPVSSEEISGSFTNNEELDSLNQDDFSFTESINPQTPKSKETDANEYISPYPEINKIFSEFDEEVSNLLLKDPSITLADDEESSDPMENARISLKRYVTAPLGMNEVISDNSKAEPSIEEITIPTEEPSEVLAPEPVLDAVDEVPIPAFENNTEDAFAAFDQSLQEEIPSYSQPATQDLSENPIEEITFVSEDEVDEDEVEIIKAKIVSVDHVEELDPIVEKNQSVSLENIEEFDKMIQENPTISDTPLENSEEEETVMDPIRDEIQEEVLSSSVENLIEEELPEISQVSNSHDNSYHYGEDIKKIAETAFTPLPSENDENGEFEMSKHFQDIDLETINHIIPADSNELNEYHMEDSEDLLDDEILSYTNAVTNTSPEINETETNLEGFDLSAPEYEAEMQGFADELAGPSIEEFNATDEEVLERVNISDQDAFTAQLDAEIEEMMRSAKEDSSEIPNVSDQDSFTQQLDAEIEAMVNGQSNVDLDAQDAFTKQLDEEILEMSKEFKDIDLETINYILPSNSNELNEYIDMDREDILDDEILSLSQETIMDHSDDNFISQAENDSKLLTEQIVEENYTLEPVTIDTSSFESNIEESEIEENPEEIKVHEVVFAPEDDTFETVVESTPLELSKELNEDDLSFDQDLMNKISELNKSISQESITTPTSNIIDEDILEQFNQNTQPDTETKTSLSKEELKAMMSEIDELFDHLPDAKIEELSQKNFYHLYIKFLDELGV